MALNLDYSSKKLYMFLLVPKWINLSEGKFHNLSKTLYKSLPLQINTFICKNLLKGDRELAHRSRGWAALPEEEDSTSWSTQWFTAICNSSSRQSKVILRPQRAPGTQVIRRHTCRQSNVHIKCISEEPKKPSAVYATTSYENTHHSTGSRNHQNTRKGNSTGTARQAEH